MQNEHNMKQQLFIGFVLFCAICIVIDNYYYINTPTERPVEVNTRKDRPVEVNIRTERPVEVNTRKERPVEVNTRTERPVEVNTRKDRPVEVNIRTERPVEVNTRKERPVEVNTRTERPVEVNTRKDRPVEVNIRTERPVEVNTRKERPVEVNTRTERPVEVKKARNKKIACYFESSTATSIESLEEEELRDPSDSEKYIFFLETSCSKNKLTSLTPRQACAVESAAGMNPNMTIYLLILSPYTFSESAKDLVDQLSTYSNINIRRIIMDDYVKNTTLEEWWSSGVIDSSLWPRVHMADVLRYLTLWKFPGMYLDLDVVVISSLEDLNDFVGSEGYNVCNCAVMHFGSSEIGRRVAASCLERIRSNFQGTSWGYNGPTLTTNVLSKICGTNQTAEMTRDRCSGFTVYPPSMFYPIHYSDWRKYFEPDEDYEIMDVIFWESRVIHVWNKLSRSTYLNVSDDVPYTRIASEYCPRIYNTKWQ